MRKLVLGSDFEVFVYHGKELIDCSILLPDATKENPIIFEGYHITHDRTCLECSIPPFPHNGQDLQFYLEVKKGIDTLSRFLKTVNPDYHFEFKDYVQLPAQRVWLKCSEENVYSKNVDKKTFFSDIVTAGLHIHFSDITKDIDPEPIVKKLDKSLGVVYKLLNPLTKRKEYGKLGTFRMKQYNCLTLGFEYRVLGGNMLNEKYLKLTSTLLNKAIKNY